MQQIAQGTYVSTEYVGVNVGFYAMPAGGIAIDAPVFPEGVRAWRQEILEAVQGPILYLILTDAHPDRVLSAALLGAPIVASKGTYEQIVTFTDGYWRAIADRWARHYPDDASELSASRVVRPEITFVDRLTLHKGGVDVTVQEVRGAAVGSVWVYLPEPDVLFAGDTVVAERHPWLASTPDSRAWLDTLSSLRRARYLQTKIVPGRGPVCDSSATEPLSAYIALTRRRVRSLRKAGSTRGEVGSLVPEFVDLYSVPSGERESIQKRVRADLERLYDELDEAQD